MHLWSEHPSASGAAHLSILGHVSTRLNNLTQSCVDDLPAAQIRNWTHLRFHLISHASRPAARELPARAHKCEAAELPITNAIIAVLHCVAKGSALRCVHSSPYCEVAGLGPQWMPLNARRTLLLCSRGSFAWRLLSRPGLRVDLQAKRRIMLAGSG